MKPHGYLGFQFSGEISNSEYYSIMHIVNHIWKSNNNKSRLLNTNHQVLKKHGQIRHHCLSEFSKNIYRILKNDIEFSKKCIYRFQVCSHAFDLVENAC